jgi:hypothetical protein
MGMLPRSGFRCRIRMVKSSRVEVKVIISKMYGELNDSDQEISFQMIR